jgi:hypothetical protein
VNEPDHVAHEAVADSGTKRLAMLAVVVLLGIVAVAVVMLSFSTRNTPFSIDGHKAVYSHNLPSSGK